MINFVNNTDPSFKISSPETPAGGTYESFLNFFMAPDNGDKQFADGQQPQSGSWDSFFPQPLPESTSFQPQETLSPDYEPYTAYMYVLHQCLQGRPDPR
ncbi:hypothetical protein FIBSPDRAFT_227405 [Athelia psychrophila]|uniref:Uncharacterized protein n=1 Tax=Athelia psychrophila TaxID=1759441 RepID=A0A165YW52_9AGAM|nr:hypothetical protein FIBSPDRAFT_227405 [Fibularhizoctonia sp. CBS 109695]